MKIIFLKNCQLQKMLHQRRYVILMKNSLNFGTVVKCSILFIQESLKKPKQPIHPEQENDHLLNRSKSKEINVIVLLF